MIEKILKIMFIIKIYTIYQTNKNEHDDDDETVSRAFKRREKGTSAADFRETGRAETTGKRPRRNQRIISNNRRICKNRRETNHQHCISGDQQAHQRRAGAEHEQGFVHSTGRNAIIEMQ